MDKDASGKPNDVQTRMEDSRRAERMRIRLPLKHPLPSAEEWNAAAERIRAAFEADQRFLAIQERNGCRPKHCMAIVCTHPAEGNCPCGEEYLRRTDPADYLHTDEPLTAAEMDEAFDELHGCMIRRPGDCCEVRKDFLAVALQVLDAAVRTAQAIEARRAETGTGSVHESAVGETDAPNPSPAPQTPTGDNV